jgi:cobalt-zinc-cadmium efflux system membrane fusion protein
MKTVASFLLKLFVLNMLLQGCKQQVDPKNDLEMVLLEGQMYFTHQQMQFGGITTGHLEKRVMASPVKANGFLDLFPQNRALVSTMFQGYVKAIEVVPGQQVEKGRVLMVLEHPEYVQLQQAYAETKASLGYLETEYERQLQLADERIASQKLFLKAQADYQSAKAMLQSLTLQLRLLGLDTNAVAHGHFTATIPIRAPISGVVSQVYAALGLLLEPQKPAMELLDVENMVLALQIFEKDLAPIQPGQLVHFQLGGYSDTWQGRIRTVGKYLDPQQKMVWVYADIEGPKNLLVPGMFAEAEIYPENTREVWALPSAAVVSMEGHQFVLVKIGETEEGVIFEKRHVETGETLGDFTEIVKVDGPRTYQSFMVAGAFALVTH